MNRSKHHLDPLLRPKSIAVVGASERPGSVGRQTMENLLTGRYPGKLYAVNPAYKSVCGVPCFPDLVSLPENVDHVVLTVGDPHIEAALDDVITHGAKAAAMMSSLVFAGDEESLMAARLASVIEEFDINPVIVSPHGCVAVDALVIGHRRSPCLADSN